MQKRKGKKSNKCQFCLYTYIHSRKTNTFTFFPQAYMENFQLVSHQKIGELLCEAATSINSCLMEGSKRGGKTTTDNMGQCNEMKCFFSFAFCTFFKIFHVRLGEKSKSVSFSRVYVCVKAKLTLVSFFYFFLHLPRRGLLLFAISDISSI